jgi:mannose-6-phosphate isomerase-like protein (cupin superfamily)
MIKNFLTTYKQIQESSHDGKAVVNLYEIWCNSDFKSKVDFIDRVVVPPGSTIGFHKHGENEEMYVVLEGQGLMQIEGDEIAVNKGDMILNPVGGSHGLVNNSREDIDILVIQVSINESKRLNK